MKIIKKSLIVLIGIVTVSCSVDDVENRAVVKPSNAPELFTPENSKLFVLNVAEKDNVAERLVWSKANFGADVEVEYTIESSLTVDNFKSGSKTSVVASTKSVSFLDITNESLNKAVLELQTIDPAITPVPIVEISVRIKASLASGEPLYSNSIPLSVQPFVPTPAYIKYNSPTNTWGLIGAATPGGWNADTDLIWNDANKTWELEVDLIADQYKFRMNKAWTTNLGTNTANDGDPIESGLSEGGKNAGITTAGRYKVVLNFKNEIPTATVTLITP